MPFKFSNYGSSKLVSGIGSADTVITVEVGSLFPFLNAGETFNLVLESSDGTYEFCTCTSRDVNDLTIVRAQENTAARSFYAGDRVELRLTAAVLNNFVQTSGATMTGDIDMDGNTVSNAVVEQPTITGGVIQGTTLRAPDNSTANELLIENGKNPTIGGNGIWHAGNIGAGSGLDADQLDGSHGAYYRDRANHTGTQAAATVSGLAPSATVDTTNAGNITAGTLGLARLDSRVLRFDSAFGSSVVRVVTSAPSDGDGANGDIWLVVSP